MAGDQVAIKEALVKDLRINAHTLLQKYENRRFDYVKDDSTTMAICSILEAVFLHNLSPKSPSFFILYSPQSVDQVSFANFLKVFVPQQLLHALDNQSIQRTNVGRCRVWIRACLNEGTLHSYMVLCSTESARLSQLYLPGAIILEADFLNQLISLIELLEELRFRLDLTSPLLNSWDTSSALQLLGLKSTHHHARDLIFDLTEPHESNPELDGLSESFTAFECSSEQFTETNVISSSPTDQSSCEQEVIPSCTNEVAPELSVASETLDVGLLEIERPSEAKISVKQNKETLNQEENEPSVSISTAQVIPHRAQEGTKKKRQTKALKSDHRCKSSAFPIKGLFSSGSNNLLAYHSTASWRSASSGSEESQSDTDSDNSINNLNLPGHDASYQTERTLVPVSVPDKGIAVEVDCSWQVIGEDLLLVLTEQDVQRLTNLYPGARSFDAEDGRNCAFHGQCMRCNRTLTPKTSFFDCYDARLYCTNCHQLQETIIPRDVIFNWDFSLQPVSQTTKSFLSGLYYKPVLNLAKLNPTLYAVLPDLLTIRQLRRALILLWHQIARCDAKVASDLRRSLRPRDYMLFSLNDLDLYSMHDLVEVHSGRLERKITSVLCDVALAHVHGCLACRRRALLCDLCEDLRRPIWPHEVTTYRRCTTPGCHKVMHVSCLTALFQEPATQSGCFTCRSPSNETGALNQFNPLVQRCRLCRTYGETLAQHNVVGHYADPFLTKVTIK